MPVREIVARKHLKNNGADAGVDKECQKQSHRHVPVPDHAQILERPPTVAIDGVAELPYSPRQNVYICWQQRCYGCCAKECKIGREGDWGLGLPGHQQEGSHW